MRLNLFLPQLAGVIKTNLTPFDLYFFNIFIHLILHVISNEVRGEILYAYEANIASHSK
jgi:hypothetical protein